MFSRCHDGTFLQNKKIENVYLQKETNNEMLHKSKTLYNKFYSIVSREHNSVGRTM